MDEVDGHNNKQLQQARRAILDVLGEVEEPLTRDDLWMQATSRADEAAVPQAFQQLLADDCIFETLDLRVGVRANHPEDCPNMGPGGDDE